MFKNNDLLQLKIFVMFLPKNHYLTMRSAEGKIRLNNCQNGLNTPPIADLPRQSRLAQRTKSISLMVHEQGQHNCLKFFGLANGFCP